MALRGAMRLHQRIGGRARALSVARRLFPAAPAAIEIELTAQLVTGGNAIATMGVIAAAIGVQAAINRDWLSVALTFSLALVAFVRLLSLRRLRARHGTQPSDLKTARRWQRDYALGSFASSLLLGVVNLYALSLRDAPIALLAVAALSCYVFSLILRTAVRPLVCLPSVAVALVLTFVGLPLFVGQGSRLGPGFAIAVLTTMAAVMIWSCVQLTGHLYRTTLNQLIARRDLIRFARQDPLTGLDNRLALRERFEGLMPGPARPAAMLYLDLDGFKPVNDLHGHQVGDALLREVAARLAACLRPGDGAFRIGGDEFVVLLPRVRQRSEAAAMARRLLTALSAPYALGGEMVRIGASIGIALADAAGGDLDELTAAADAALYEAKRDGRGAFRFAKDESSLRLIA